MNKINLLPKEFGPKGSLLRLIAFLNKLATILFFLTFVGGLVSLSYVFLLKVEINSLKKRVSVLEKSVRTLQGTEQKLSSIKERLAKIKTAMSIKTIDEKLPFYENLIFQGQDLKPVSLKVTLEKADLVLTGNNSLAVKNYLSSMLANPDFKNLKINSFFSTSEGKYYLDMEFIPN